MNPSSIRPLPTAAPPPDEVLDREGLPGGGASANLPGGLVASGLRVRSLPFARPDLTHEEVDAVARVLASGWLTSGPETQAFEAEFAQAVGARHAVALNSATAGLHLGLALENPGPKDGFLVPAITFTATAEVVAYSGSIPILLDVDRDSYLMSPEIIEEFFRKECNRTGGGRFRHRATGVEIRGILPVHFGGRPCEMDGILSIAKENDLCVVEDAAHAFPTRYNGRPIGSVGPLAVFSFYATKNLTTGEGGMITTDDSETAERLGRMRLHGIKGQTYGRKRWHYDVVEQGYKYNMMDMCAALGRVQLRRSAEMLRRRQSIDAIYRRELHGLAGLRLSPETPHESSYHLFTIELGPDAPFTRDRFVDEMLARGIGTSLHFIPLYRHSYYRELYELSPEAFPASEEFFARTVSLPIYSLMTDEDARDVCAAVRTLYQTTPEAR